MLLSLNSKSRIAHVRVMTALQAFSKEDARFVIGFLSTEGLNPLDIHHEICVSAMCGSKCICKAETYKWVTKSSGQMAGLHDAGHPGQAHKGCSVLLAEGSGKRVFPAKFMCWCKCMGKQEDCNWKIGVLFVMHYMNKFCIFYIFQLSFVSPMYIVRVALSSYWNVFLFFFKCENHISLQLWRIRLTNLNCFLFHYVLFWNKKSRINLK